MKVTRTLKTSLEGMPAQVPSSSSDRGSKLRGPSQNSPRVASKWNFNITKINSGYLDIPLHAFRIWTCCSPDTPRRYLKCAKTILGSFNRYQAKGCHEITLYRTIPSEYRRTR
ncbi:hypothetical protein AVEN_119087-1 [Araneus ventricosus]|uniref:Uncharacterized protein n=1 Tax=Araneus ventricosus TaxID=182803 RepID=A0A4Y2BM58_ARAVE|nr:hypothetical protein AVEN_119087-1 [Araneus ventricosus]